MPVAFSDEGWQEFKLYWARMKREQVDRTDLSTQRNPPTQVPGALFYPIPFRNDSGETIPAFAVMRVLPSVSLGSIPMIAVGKPNSTFKRRYLVNGPFPVSGASGQNTFGLGTWADQSAYVLYDDANTPAEGEEWGPSNGSWKIKKYRYGFHILGGATGGDTDLVGCYQAVVNQFLGKADADITSGSTGTVSIYDGNEADTSDSEAGVKNRTEITASSNTWVRCVFLGGKWFLEPWECP